MRSERLDRAGFAVDRTLRRADARRPRRRTARVRPASPRAPRRRLRGARARGSCPGTAGRRARRRRAPARPSHGTAARRGRDRRRSRSRASAPRATAAPRPAPRRHSASAAALPSFSTPTGRSNVADGPAAQIDTFERDVRRPVRDAGLGIEVARHAEPDPGRRPVQELFDRCRHPGEDRLLGGRRSLVLDGSLRPCRRARRGRRGSSSRRHPPRSPGLRSRRGYDIRPHARR